MEKAKFDPRELGKSFAWEELFGVGFPIGLAARLAERAYRRGYQQGHFDGVEGTEIAVDLHSWRYDEDCTQAICPQSGETLPTVRSALERLQIEEREALGRAFAVILDTSL